MKLLSGTCLLAAACLLLACSPKTETTSNTEGDTLAAASPSQSDSNSKYGALQAELQRCQSLASSDTRVDFKIGDLLSLPRTYSEAHLLDIFQNDELAMVFSFVTRGEGLNTYYLCYWDKQRMPYVERVGEGKDARFVIVQQKCSDCDAAHWFVFNEADKSTVRRYFYSGYIETEGFSVVHDYDSAQLKLNQLLANFEKEKNSLLQLSYDESSDVVVSRLSYLFSGSTLKYVFETVTEEGGTGSNQLTRIEDGVATTLLTSFEDPGYFRVRSGKADGFFEVYPTREVPPTVVGPASEKVLDLETAFAAHKKTVKEHQADFKPAGDDLEYFPDADKSKKYTVSAQLIKLL